MLAKGIQLTLMIGPVVPVPAPRVVMDALDKLEVRTSAGAVGGFTLTFKFNSKSELNTIFIIAGAQNASPVTPRPPSLSRSEAPIGPCVTLCSASALSKMNGRSNTSNSLIPIGPNFASEGASI